jgi:transcriptional repressor NrdR
LLRGIIRACEKTGIPQQRLEILVDEIESQIQQNPDREVTSNQIGEIVLQQLQLLSEVAYVRFASVYQQFQGIRDFVHTLNHLENRGDRGSLPLNQRENNPPVISNTSVVS